MDYDTQMRTLISVLLSRGHSVLSMAIQMLHSRSYSFRLLNKATSVWCVSISAVLHLHTWVHLIAVNVGATVAAADTGEGGNRVSIAVTVTEKKRKDTRWEYLLTFLYSIWYDIL